MFVPVIDRSIQEHSIPNCYLWRLKEEGGSATPKRMWFESIPPNEKCAKVKTLNCANKRAVKASNKQAVTMTRWAHVTTESTVMIDTRSPRVRSPVS